MIGNRQGSRREKESECFTSREDVMTDNQNRKHDHMKVVKGGFPATCLKKKKKKSLSD